MHDQRPEKGLLPAAARRKFAIRFVALLTLSGASATLAQDRPLQPVLQGDLATPRTYTLRAGAGNLISGTLERQGTPATGTVALYDANGLKLKEEQFWGDYSGPLPIAFVTPKKGAYQIRIRATSPTGGSYTLRTETRTPAEQVAGVAVTPTIRDESARMAQLVRDATAGRAGAVERFWSQAKARGGPLVETIDGNDREVLVTFLWKEIYETHNVFLIWPGDATQSQDHFMSRIPGTNLWFKTVRVLRGSRFSYQLAPNDRGEDPHHTAQTDPLNPILFTDGDRSNAYGSILELPGATDESWFRRTPSIRGTITHRTFESVLMKGRRDVSVYTPPGYAPAQGPYALLILFDGPGYAGGMRAPNTLDNLIADHRIVPTVVCFVGYTPDGARLADLLSQTYAAAIATELVPWLKSSYAVSADRNNTVIGGYSAGGGAAGFIALKYPAVFGRVLLQSGGTPRLLLTEIDSSPLPIRFYFDVGLYEEGVWRANAPAALTSNESGIQAFRRLRDILRAKGYEVTFRETPAAHEGVHFRATLAEGLVALLGLPAK